MIPATVTKLDAFPLTPNGKVDRKALPEPSRERSSRRELVVPRTELERELTEIWERELQISPIGVTDDFFELGVTSIVAATLFAAIEHEFGRSLPLGAIFRAPTVESLAGLLGTDVEASRWTSLIPIQPNGTQTPIFCVHGGAGTILHLQGLSRALGDDQPFYGLQSRGLYGGASPPRTVEQMATHYLKEMRQVQPPGPWRLGGYCFGAIVAFEMAQRLVAAGETVELLAMFNGPSPDWIKRWGWYGNQPSWRLKRALPVKTFEQVQRARRRRRLIETPLDMLGRVPRALAQPQRLARGFWWHSRGLRARVRLLLGRPIPEHEREEFFLELHQKAERAYAPRPYPGELLAFSGEGLYEDLMMGWDGYAEGGILTFAAPGEHTSNRDVMHEPAASYVADRLREYLAR
jgi:thioesterase domain-containing protein/acyl carrier protein